MATIVVVVVYIIGGLLTYFFNRYMLRNKYGGYNIQDRYKGIGLSLFSWLGFIVLLMTEIEMWVEDKDDKPASW